MSFSRPLAMVCLLGAVLMVAGMVTCTVERHGATASPSNSSVNERTRP